MTEQVGLPFYPACAGLLGLALAACTPATAKPTTDLPIAAPDGASQIVSEFVELCSQALVEPVRVNGALARRGWQVGQSASDTNLMQDILSADHPDLDLTIQIIPLDYPHLQGIACSVSRYSFDTYADTENLSGLDDLPGFLGGFREYGRAEEAMKIGRWSAIAPDGEPITVTATLMPDSNFLNLNMNHARRVTPDVDTKQ